MADLKEQHQRLANSPYSLSRLTFREVEKELSRLPALIVPLGGCEPYGECGPLGVASVCAEAMAAALSEKLHILLAPALAFGCSTPYNAFGGTAGVTPRTLTNILCETIRQWYRQGFRTMVIIDGLYDNSEAVDLAARRLKCAHPAMKIILFSLQRDERIRAFIGQYFHEKESGRAAYGMLSLAAYIDPAMIREGAAVGPQQALPDTERYRTWRKRGADPDQYRKLFPHACSGSTTHGFDPEFGRELFGFILHVLVDTVTPSLKSCHQ